VNLRAYQHDFFGVQESRFSCFTGSRLAGLGVFRRAASTFHQPKRGASRQDAGRRASDHSAVNKGAPHDISNGPIRVWIVGATGFRQSWHRVTGLELLWRKMRKLSRPDVCVTTPQRWNQNPEAMAAYIARNSQPGAVVFFYGYSYGVGNYFLAFARALQGYGIAIDTAVLCDGVRRFKAAKFLSFRWFAGMFLIQVPANVETVYAFHQRADQWLQGHRVAAADPERTDVEMIEQFGFDHNSIDESQTFHRVALKEAEDVIARA
jgi:hypothetical protein